MTTLTTKRGLAVALLSFDQPVHLEEHACDLWMKSAETSTVYRNFAL